MSKLQIESLKFDNLNYRYEGGEWMFEDCNFTFPMNRVVKVDSASGRGKSTLLKLMAGLLTPQKGHYIINDLTVNEMSFEEFLPLRLQIGYSFDLGGLLNNRTLVENIILPLLYHKICSPNEAHERTKEMVHWFGLNEVADKRPSSVSGSQRKATCLARTLVTSPQMLLLDDPTTGLSRRIIDRLVDMIQVQQRKELKHIFLVSEDPQFLKAFDLSHIHIDQMKVSDGDLIVRDDFLGVA